jgi:hypothetical protein
MTKREAAARFRANILPGIPADDKPAKRQAWNDYVDALQRDGAITERQASSWDQPAFIKK